MPRALRSGLTLVTANVFCEYLAELSAFDELAVRMRLMWIRHHRIRMNFEYWRRAGGGKELIARREQQVARMMREGDLLTPAPARAELRYASRDYAAG